MENSETYIYNEDMEKEKCFICGKEHTIEHYKEKGLYQGKYTHDEPFPDYYICYCNSCNKKYQALRQKARDTNYKFEKQLLSKIRKAIKKECKTLSIRVSHSVWDISIKPLDKNKPYRSFNFEELKTLVKFKIFDSTETKTNLATIKDMYYFYLTRTDLIEPEEVVKPKTEGSGLRFKGIDNLESGISVIKVKTPKTNGLGLKILENGELASYIPKKVWYALFKQGIIVKENGKWVVDLTKKDQIKIPLEVVEKSVIKQKNSHSHLKEHKQWKNTKNNDFNDFKDCVKQTIEYANGKMKEFLENREENLPVFAIGEPTDMMASLKGESSRIKSVDYISYGSSGFVWIQFFNLNTQFGRWVRKWDKEEPDNPLGFSKSHSSRYGHSLYPKINGTHTQIIEQKTEAYKHFVSKLKELLLEKDLGVPDLYVKSRMT